jgi:ABC-type polysaccharide/polyol phosphate export permease
MCKPSERWLSCSSNPKPTRGPKCQPSSSNVLTNSTYLALVNSSCSSFGKITQRPILINKSSITKYLIIIVAELWKFSVKIGFVTNPKSEVFRDSSEYMQVNSEICFFFGQVIYHCWSKPNIINMVVVVIFFLS